MLRVIRPIAVVALLSALTAACGSDTDGSAPAGGAAGEAPAKVVIAYGAPVAAQLLPSFAEDQGLFEKHHLDVTIEQITNASTVIPGLRSGKVNFNVMASPQPEQGAAAGVELKWLAMWNSKPDLQLCVQDGVDAVGDLRGKPVGVSSEGSTTGVLLRDFLQQGGLDLDAVELVPLGNQSAQAQSFVAGQIAAFICAPPVTQSVIEKRKGAKVLANLADTYSWNGAGLVGYVPWVEDNEDTTSRVVAALREAWEAWKTSPDAAQATIVKVADVSPEAAKASYDSSLTVMSDTFAPSVDVERDVLRVLSGQLPNTKDLSADDLVDATFAG